MKLKISLTLSILLHLCFFTVTFLLSANRSGRFDSQGSLPRDNSRISDENLFYVKLTEDISNTGNGKSVVETKKSKHPEVPQIKSKKDPVIVGIESYRDIQNPVSIKEVITDETNKDLDTRELSIHKEPANNILIAGYKTGKDSPFSISDIHETAFNISYNSSSSENRLTPQGSKDRGIVHPWIIESIRNSIERAKTYPVLARKRGIEGTVYISFRISSKGEPRDIKVSRGSGSRILDNATLDIVKKAAPFPYVDSQVEVQVVFRLK